jgi:methyltransferase (TIGR00027 family)
MQASTESHTAKIAAAYRARASERPDPVCQDSWARHLVGDGEESRTLLGIGDAAVPEIELAIALRTAWLDDALRAWTGSQVVLLGAGLDTRAARLARPGVRFFEVDFPSTQAYKCRLLDRLPSYPRHAATMVPCDFEYDDFVTALECSGFRREHATLVLWEGVTAYLTEAAVRATMRRITTTLGPQSRLMFDYLGSPPARDDGFARVAEDVGEPFRFMTDDIRPLACDEGFAEVEVSSMMDACRDRLRAANAAPLYDRWFLATAHLAAA